MEFRSGTETFYRQMLELQDKLRKSEEERLKLEEKFNEIMQQGRDAEYERLRIMRHKYHKFLEEDKARQERNENILRTLDQIESRAKQLAAKTDRFKAFRKQYFENYLKQIPKQKQQTFDLNTQSTNRPQYQNESARRKLFADKPTTVNENVEMKLALLEKYLRDNFDNFPRDFPSSTTTQNGLYTGKPTNVLYDNKNYLDDASDSKESQEIEVDKYSPSKMNGHYPTPGELLGNKIEQELDRLRNKKENELNNNSLDVQELNPEQVINDYKKLVSNSEEKFGLRNGLQNGIPKKTEIQIDEANKLHMDIPYNYVDKKEKSNLLEEEEEENSEDTKPPTDISLNLSSTSQLKEQFDESKQDEIEILPQIYNEEYLENSSKSEEITSIEKQKVQPINVQIKESNEVTKPILNQSEEITKTPEISNNEEKIEKQNIEYDSKLDALNYSEQENIQTNQQFIEKPQSGEFGEAVSNQPYSKEQKYLPETLSEEQYATQQNEIQEQYNDEVQSDFKQNYENIKPQDDTEVYNEQRYESPEQQYGSPKEQYESPEQQYESPEQQYESPEQQYKSPKQQYESPEKQFQQKELYENSEYENPKHEFEASEKQPYVNPEHQFEAPEEQYPQLEQQYESSEQYMNPEQQYVAPEQYINPEQPYVNPEEKYVTPEQFVNPEQQEYPPENYDPQYPQQTYPEGEYDPQSYPEVYETQQPENYDTQQYPQQQYPEGYDPQQYTEGQQLEYDQQYPQGEGYQDQQYVGNTEYDPQENLYQTGQEYLQGEQNVDLQYEAEQQQDYPEGYTGQEIEQNNAADENETVTESDAVAAVSEQKPLEDNKPLVQKKLPNLAEMLDTDTSESVKPDSKVSDSDFDFSNTKT